MPICIGGRLHTRWGFVPILENELADFIMPDVTWTGGISELKKIATMAEAYYVPMSPKATGIRRQAAQWCYRKCKKKTA